MTLFYSIGLYFLRYPELGPGSQVAERYLIKSGMTMNISITNIFLALNSGYVK